MEAAEVCHHSIVLPYTAYLRVYQPVTALPRREQAYWRAYAESSGGIGRVEAMAAEHADALRRLVAAPPVLAPEQESRDAYVRVWGDDTYICPWQTRLRSWLAVREFRSATPARLSAAFVPEPVAQATEEAFQRWRDRGEPLRTHILTSTWGIPLPWFAPFAAGERRLVLEAGPDPATARGDAGVHAHSSATGSDRTEALPGTQPSRALVYVTEMATARRRLEHAIQVLETSLGDSAALGAGKRLEDWLAGVAHPGSLLELDYGGLVHLLDDDELRDDESVAEVAAAITGLETGHEELTVAMYQRVTQRWKSIQALEHAN
ncbi:hypothetical protein NOGI109294_18795 [Nocardiopsis gilva]